jgi:ribosomal protein L37E
VRTSRLTKLERHVRSRPCAGCGQPFHPPDPERIDWDRLTVSEQRELTGLFAEVSTPVCVRCGRSSFEVSRMTDEQLNRALQLLRKLLGRQGPDDHTNESRHSALDIGLKTMVS